MIKKNIKFLLTYILAIVISLFLTMALGWVFDFSPKLFSALTAIVTFMLIYTEAWKFGKYDALRKENSLIKGVLSTGFFAIIAVAAEALAAVCKLWGLNGLLFYVNMAGMIWFYPFTGFYTEAMFLIVTPIVTLLVIGVSVFGYFMGIRGFSFADKFVTRKNARYEKKKEKHFAEIEKIKEQYRKKD